MSVDAEQPNDITEDVDENGRKVYISTFEPSSDPLPTNLSPEEQAKRERQWVHPVNRPGREIMNAIALIRQGRESKARQSPQYTTALAVMKLQQAQSIFDEAISLVDRIDESELRYGEAPPEVQERMYKALEKFENDPSSHPEALKRMLQSEAHWLDGLQELEKSPYKESDPQCLIYWLQLYSGFLATFGKRDEAAACRKRWEQMEKEAQRGT